MQEVQDESVRRQQRLQAFVDEKHDGNLAEAGRSLGYKSGAFLSQLLDKKQVRKISEKTIKKVEAKKGCAGWFTLGHQPQPAVTIIETDDLVAAIAAMTAPLKPATRRAIASMLSSVAEDPSAVDEAVTGISALASAAPFVSTANRRRSGKS